MRRLLDHVIEEAEDEQIEWDDQVVVAPSEHQESDGRRAPSEEDDA